MKSARRRACAHWHALHHCVGRIASHSLREERDCIVPNTPRIMASAAVFAYIPDKSAETVMDTFPNCWLTRYP
jgi:hypothetical protein